MKPYKNQPNKMGMTPQHRAVAATMAGTAMAVPVFVGTKKKNYLACCRLRKV